MALTSVRILVSALLFATVCAEPIILERLSQVYLPFKIDESGKDVYCFGEAAAEQLVYDPSTAYVYVSGNKLLRVLDISVPSSPSVVFTKEVPGEITDVVHCGDYIAASVPGDPESSPGTVFIYSPYTDDKGLELLYEVEVGALPDAIAFTPQCSKLLVANEGEAGMTKEGKFINPEGSVSIIDMKKLEKGDVAAEETVDFTSFNKDAESITESGVRWVWRGQGLRPSMMATQTLSKDLEPEQVVVSEDGKTVFVNLQENNAVAVLDLETKRFTAITSYGEKDLSLKQNALDTSATNGPGVLRSWSGVFSLFQPDAIAVFSHKGEDYIITANEGDQKEYFEEDHGIPTWIEFVDGAELANRTEGIPDETVEALADPDSLGALPISIVDGIAGQTADGKNVYDRLVTYGGRSWSIYKVSNMEQVYDSGNDFERVMGTFMPWAFNSDGVDELCLELPPDTEDTADVSLESESNTLIDTDLLDDMITAAIKEEERLEALSTVRGPETAELEFPSNALTTTPNDTADARSTSRGPEPEAVAVGNLGGRRVVFVTLERGGAIFVYDASDPLSPIWQSTYYPGAHGKTWAELYNNKELVDIDPEGLAFVSAGDSPIDDPLLIVSGAVSGTVSIHAVRTGKVTADCEKEAEVIDDGKTTLVISTQTDRC